MNRFFLALALFLCSAGIFYFILRGTYDADWAVREAKRIQGICASELHPTFCYEKEIPKIVDHGRSMEEGFALIKAVQEVDSSFIYCHIAAHGLAEREIAKDPSKWKEVALRAPLEECSAGALHGVFRMRFSGDSGEVSAEEVLNDLSTICTSPDLRTVYMKNSCMHASGHMLMYQNNGSLPDAYTSCDLLSAKMGQGLPVGPCYNGAGMQFFYLLEMADQILVEGKRPTSFDGGLALCSAFTGARFSTCISEAVLGYHPQKMSAPEISKALLGCERIIDDAQGRYACIWRGFAVFGTRVMSEEMGVEEICSYFKGEYADSCYSASITRSIELDVNSARHSLSICVDAQKAGFGRSCYESFSRAIAVILGKESANALALCEVIPTEYLDQCRLWVKQPPQGLIGRAR